MSAEYKKYLSTLKSKSFSGDIEDRYPARLLCATDNSVYQCLPAAVIFPRNTADIALALSLAQSKEFSSVSFAPRGGGTGTNGQSLNKGIMIDCSRHMKEYRDFNAEKREVTVQAGVIKDELNEFLKPHGLFFSPELSTSSRATIGGMISNDAAGQGSVK
ncbi:FAD-binding protein, partial [uncultured Succinatimonas sp.]|uniref:FAD-binding oxidoreductase n=1 Tax=uncultured Succinatimonas sp. TaxID=1262973 RepID=UPI0027D99BBD